MRPPSIFIPLVVLFILNSPASAVAVEPARGPVEAPSAVVTAEARPQWGERVPYRSFDGFDYSVTAYPGVHVEILLSDS